MLIPFSVDPALFSEGLLPGDKRVNRYYISIENYLFNDSGQSQKVSNKLQLFQDSP